MPIECINFKKHSPDLKKFVEQGWTSFQEFEAEVDAKRRTPPSNPSFSRFVSRSLSMKKRKPASIFNSLGPNNSVNRGHLGRLSSEDKERFVIEDVSSDDEPKEKKIGLCTQKGNQIMVNLSRRKQRASAGDESNTSKQSKSSTNSSSNLNGSYSPAQNSSFGNRSTSSESSAKSPGSNKSRTEPKVNRSKQSIEKKNEARPSQSISDVTTPESVPATKPASSKQATTKAIPATKPPNPPLNKFSSDSPAAPSRRKPNLVAHSTPKGKSLFRLQ